MVYGSGTGSICYDQGLDEHSSLSQNHSKSIGKLGVKAFFTAERRYHKPPLRGGQGALTRTPTLRRRGSVGLIASTVTSDELRWVSGDYGAEKGLHNTFSHVFLAPGNSPVKLS